MNRWDSLKGAALDVAQHVTQDPAQRDAMANDLLTLMGHMLGAVGKVVAGEGERALNEAHDMQEPWADGSYVPRTEQVAEFEAEKAEEATAAHGRYIMGESIQRAVAEVVLEGRTADLARWVDMDRDYGKPGNRYGWHPRCAHCGERGGHTSQCDVRCGGTADGPNCGWDSNCPNGH